MLTKRKKIIIIVLSAVAIFLIAFTPIPKTFELGEGTALSLNSLTYKVVIWDMFDGSLKPYKETDFLFSPNNFTDTETIWENKENNLRTQGYGAISALFTVKKIENGCVFWINEITNDGNAIADCIITDKDIEDFGSDISSENITVGTVLDISFDGFILETYPCSLGRIYKIKQVDIKTTVTGEKPIIDNTDVSQPQEETVTSSTDDTESQDTIYNNDNSSSSNISSTSSTSNTSSTPSEYYAPNFWEQTIHCYDEYYDSTSNIYIPYMVIEPKEYDPNKKYPVILFLHGAGYRYQKIKGYDVNNLQIQTLSNSYSYNYQWMEQALIIAPHISVNDWWDFGSNSDGSLDAAMRIFEKVISEYSCDSSRYYVTGGSMGGYATWAVAAKYNDVFAAAMPMCGWWDTSDAYRLTDMPIRIIHGTADTTVSVRKSKEMYNAIKSAGGNKVQLALYEGSEHDVWRAAYFDEETFEWLFSQYK